MSRIYNINVKTVTLDKKDFDRLIDDGYVIVYDNEYKEKIMIRS